MFRNVHPECCLEHRIRLLIVTWSVTPWDFSLSLSHSQIWIQSWSTPERIAQSGALTLQIKHYGLSTLQVDKKPTKNRRGARTWVKNMILLRSRIHTLMNLTNSLTWTMRVHSKATKVTGRPATCHPKLKRRTRLYTWEKVNGTHQWNTDQVVKVFITKVPYDT